MRATVGIPLVVIGLLLPFSVWAQGDDALTVAARQAADRFVQASEQKQGVVADVDAATAPVTLYVTLGSKDGILAGQLLAIFAKGDPIVVDGKVVGNRMKTVGTAEITQVQNENLCMAAMKTTVPGQQPARDNVASLKGVPHMLAVSTFLRPDNAGSMMGQEFADKLGAALQASGRFGMLERARFDAVLGELKLGLNDLFDPAKVAQLGKQLQAQGIVLGTITQQNDRYAINARVVEIQSGVQVASATATCGRSDELDAKYGRTATAVGGGVSGTTTPPPPVASVFSRDVKWLCQGPYPPKLVQDAVVAGGVYWSAAIALQGEATAVLEGKWQTLQFEVAVPDAAGSYKPLVEFVGDGRLLGSAQPRWKQKPVQVRLDVSGVQALTIRADCDCNPASVSSRVHLRQGTNMQQPIISW